jgi:hypothetical protein
VLRRAKPSWQLGYELLATKKWLQAPTSAHFASDAGPDTDVNGGVVAAAYAKLDGFDNEIRRDVLLELDRVERETVRPCLVPFRILPDQSWNLLLRT